MNIFRNPAAPAVEALLASASLPSSDLTPAHLADFFGCGPENSPAGIVGIEVHGSVALLRSLAVTEKSRGRGCGKALVAAAEREARARRVRTLYLLTTTAERFFERLGYAGLPREAAPAAIRRTREFAELCPSSSTLMAKSLTADPRDDRR
jgi:amino-acid N-acetyltransferase